MEAGSMMGIRATPRKQHFRISYVSSRGFLNVESIAW